MNVARVKFPLLRRSSRVVSPLVILIFAATAFELMVRLPYVAYVMNSATTGNAVRVHFFSVYDPVDVIFIGLSLLACAVMLMALIVLVMRPVYSVPSVGFDLPRISAGIYVIAAAVFLASFAAVLMVGSQALLEAFSSKRSELGERGLLWALLKVAVFMHLVCCLLYIRAVQTGRTFDKVLFWASLVTLCSTTLVFSQRAILISFVIEMIYIQLLLGTFRLRRIFLIGLLVAAVLVAVSALRPGVQFASIWEGLLFGAERIVYSRYFFDFAKLGTVFLWDSETTWLGPVSVGFLFEPFLGDRVIFYKEIGPIIASEAYLYRTENGITPGAYLEAILSFGVVGGVLFLSLAIASFLALEKRIITGCFQSIGKLLFLLLIVSKFSLFLNSSFGAFAFQLTLETVLLCLCLPLLARWSPKRVRGVAPIQST